MKNLLKACVIIANLICVSVYASQPFISFSNDQSKSLTISCEGNPVYISWDAKDHKGVRIALNSLKEDFSRVTGEECIINENYNGVESIIIGSFDKSRIIKEIVKSGKIDKRDLIGKREKYIITVIDNPAGKGGKALVIAGSDMRGTIFGIYELSSQIGVSPWHYWADVPVNQKKNIYAIDGIYTDGEPAVQYRGIFINDEWPAFGGWTNARFGGFNSKMYKHVFELILRLKGNFLWPAMWSAAFYTDDPENGKLANDMGIIVGTSHHEPMGKPHQEWRKVKDNIGNGVWNYSTNKPALNDFFADGVDRLKDWESVVTIGMRGDGDEPMSRENNIALLEDIIKNQRDIIKNVTGRRCEATPQMWALYKEVQEYYDEGMRVPDDVILLLCDDNWGNVRKLPDLNAKKHKGGYGMYYHFDYVGGPRSYRWLNVSQIQRIWEQMNMTYDYGVDKLWVVNVGDIKPMEFPINFWFDMAWDPTRFSASNLIEYTEDFCNRQFGENYGRAASFILNKYCKYNYRVTPEILSHDTYSLENNEFKSVCDEYKALEADALNLYLKLPGEYKDAYNQLILFPVQAMSNLYELYFSLAMNRKLSSENDIRANLYADKVKECFERDAALCHSYGNDISSGKWIHMMDQPHIGYTGWDNPKRNICPNVYYVDSLNIKNGGYVFIKNDYIISMEAEHYYASKNNEATSWTVIPDYGKTLSAITLQPANVSTEGSELKYKMKLDSDDSELEITVYLSTTLAFNDNKGLRYTLSVDGSKSKIINFNQDASGGNHDRWLSNRIIENTERFTIEGTNRGEIVISICPLDPGIVFQKIVVNTRPGLKRRTYLGAVETPYIRE